MGSGVSQTPKIISPLKGEFTYMTIYPICATMMKYRIFQTLAEAYYRYRVKKPCFIMQQNDRWTLVTMDR